MEVNREIETVNEPVSETVSASVETTTVRTLAPGLRLLIGHESQETAYLQDNYPYGRDRCQRKLWIETKPKHGQRFVAQTQSPKNGRWNNPHKSTYDEILVMVLDERPESETHNHVLLCGVSIHASEEKLDAFIAAYGPALQSEYHKKKLNVIRAFARASANIKFSIVPAGQNPGASLTSSAAAMGREVARELAVIESQA